MAWNWIPFFIFYFLKQIDFYFEEPKPFMSNATTALQISQSLPAKMNLSDYLDGFFNIGYVVRN